MWKIGIKTHTCEELVPNPTHLKNGYPSITDVKNWYLIVTGVSDKIVENWNRMQNAADLGIFYQFEEYACMLYEI